MIHDRLTLNLPQEVAVLDGEELGLSAHLRSINLYLKLETVIREENSDWIHCIVYTGNLKSKVNYEMIKEMKKKYDGTYLREK